MNMNQPVNLLIINVLEVQFNSKNLTLNQKSFFYRLKKVNNLELVLITGVERVTSRKVLAVMFDVNLSFKEKIASVSCLFFFGAPQTSELYNRRAEITL